MAEIDGIANEIVETGLSDAQSIRGCTEEEIAAFERVAGCPLPLRYREFLERMGRGAGHFFKGSDMFLPAILEIREWAEELLAENNHPFRLEGPMLVFGMHQGYQFIFMDSDAGDDPPVHWYMEGRPRPEELAPSFSAFLRKSLKDHLRVSRSSGRFSPESQ